MEQSINNLKPLFIHLASKGKKCYDNPFKNLETATHFKSPKAKLKSPVILKQALDMLDKSHELIDLVGTGQKGDIYSAMQLLAMLDKELEDLPSSIDQPYLIVDFKHIKNNNDMPLGVKIFQIIPSEVDKDEDMIRRSED
jgi:hypothetical protein